MILRSAIRAIATALAAAAPWVAAAQGPASLVQETVWSLDVDVVAIGPGMPGTLGTFPMSASRATPGSVEVPLGSPLTWPGGALHLTAAIDRLLEDEASVDLAADLVRPDRKTVHASRRFALREGGSQILEVFGEGDRRLLLSIRGEQGTRPVARKLASVGEPVILRVEIEKVEGARAVPLETNDLHTFVGEPVEYSFDLGGDQDRMRLVLTPVSLTGSIAQIRAQISGQLPDPSGPIILSRDQRFAASRGATSSMEVVAGNPPRGYRFRITPEF